MCCLCQCRHLFHCSSTGRNMGHIMLVMLALATILCSYLTIQRLIKMLSDGCLRTILNNVGSNVDRWTKCTVDHHSALLILICFKYRHHCHLMTIMKFIEMIWIYTEHCKYNFVLCCCLFGTFKTMCFIDRRCMLMIMKVLSGSMISENVNK